MHGAGNIEIKSSRFINVQRGFPPPVTAEMCADKFQSRNFVQNLRHSLRLGIFISVVAEMNNEPHVVIPYRPEHRQSRRFIKIEFLEIRVEFHSGKSHFLHPYNFGFAIPKTRMKSSEADKFRVFFTFRGDKIIDYRNLGGNCCSGTNHEFFDSCPLPCFNKFVSGSEMLHIDIIKIADGIRCLADYFFRIDMVMYVDYSVIGHFSASFHQKSMYILSQIIVYNNRKAKFEQ